MSTNILLPALSPGMQQATLSRWIKREGDMVKIGDAIAEIETDKSMMELESAHEGILAKILVPEGSTEVPIHTVIALLRSLTESVVETETLLPASRLGPAALVLESSQATPASVERAVVTDPLSAVDRGTRIFASPLARRLAGDGGIDLALVRGSGPRGRIIERDILDIQASDSSSAPVSTLTSISTPKQASEPISASTRILSPPLAPASTPTVKLPHDAMRKTIARRMLVAKQTIPHFYLSVDCELDALIALKGQLNQSAPLTKDSAPLYKVSINDFAVKALGLALARVPEANVSWTEEAILRHQHADVGVAVSIPGGLITPIVRQAELKTLSTISNEIKDFSARAKVRKLRSEEYQGGTTTISNLGMFGVKDFAAIINPPHATILAIGAAEKRIVVKSDQPAMATIMSCTLSVDHRAVDGAMGARLLANFKGLIECPVSMFV